ncbi:MAG: RNA polymerase sigma factor [Candidatus Krumholzibacteriota bacterium]|nr:RNA polymerase sigma factor [Candidatus Krumholzibacteriota bacterium]
MALDNERQVVHEWKNGSRKAYEALVKHYMADAYMVAYGFVGNREDARDLSQDAFVKAYQARERFDASRPFYPWLYRIIKNHCLNFLRCARRSTSSLFYEGETGTREERFAATAPTALEELEASERRRLVRAAVDVLSDDHREIVVLKNFKGCSYREISDMLDIPMGTVMSRLYYARKDLREIIERLEREGLSNEPAGEVA